MLLLGTTYSFTLDYFWHNIRYKFMSCFSANHFRHIQCEMELMGTDLLLPGVFISLYYHAIAQAIRSFWPSTPEFDPMTVCLELVMDKESRFFVYISSFFCQSAYVSTTLICDSPWGVKRPYSANTFILISVLK